MFAVSDCNMTTFTDFTERLFDIVSEFIEIDVSSCRHCDVVTCVVFSKELFDVVSGYVWDVIFDSLCWLTKHVISV